MMTKVIKGFAAFTKDGKQALRSIVNNHWGRCFVVQPVDLGIEFADETKMFNIERTAEGAQWLINNYNIDSRVKNRVELEVKEVELTMTLKIK